MIELLTVKETAGLLKTSKAQIRKMIQAGDLLAVKVGREYQIPLASIKEIHRKQLRIASPMLFADSPNGRPLRILCKRVEFWYQ